MGTVYKQKDFLEMVGKRNREIEKKGGKVIDPARVVTDVESAIAEMGMNVGLLGTVLDELSELEDIGNFSSLHSRTVMNFVELLQRKKELEQEGGYQELERLLAPAIEAARKEILQTEVRWEIEESANTLKPMENDAGDQQYGG